MKIEEQVLSIEQMNYLQDLGVDTSDASMCWLKYTRNDGVVRCLINVNDISCHVMPTMEAFPTYTIGDLIKKLPKSIDFGYGEYELEILIKGGYVEVQYTNGGDYTPFSYSQSSLIESLYSMLCELAVNHKELLNDKNE